MVISNIIVSYLFFNLLKIKKKSNYARAARLKKSPKIDTLVCFDSGWGVFMIMFEFLMQIIYISMAMTCHCIIFRTVSKKTIFHWVETEI